MIEKRQVQDLADRWQTTADNVIREYFQQLFLSRLYQEKAPMACFLKGERRYGSFGRALAFLRIWILRG